MPRLARIHIHPFKSLDPQSVVEAVLLPCGALEHDRRFGLLDPQGDCVNGKRTPAAHRLRTHFDPATRRLNLRIEGNTDESSFDVDAERAALVDWLSRYFDTPLEIYENPDGGFPDDFRFPGPTVISTATLATVASWFAGMTLDDARGRFRANLEVDDVEPFWEDRLLAEGLGQVRFQIGKAELLGANPCERCVVPSRDAHTGEVLREFAKTFAQRRKETLPAWAPADRFDHYYRLSVNTAAGAGDSRTIRVGDEVRIIGVE